MLLFLGKNEIPLWEGYGRLKALPTKNKFHWYEKQIVDLSRLTLRE